MYPKCKTVAFKNSDYIRAVSVWNTLPCQSASYSPDLTSLLATVLIRELSSLLVLNALQLALYSTCLLENVVKFLYCRLFVVYQKFIVFID